MFCGGTTLSSTSLQSVVAFGRLSAFGGCSTSLVSCSGSPVCRRQYLRVVKIFSFICSKSTECDEKLLRRFKFIWFLRKSCVEPKFRKKKNSLVKCEFNSNVSRICMANTFTMRIKLDTVFAETHARRTARKRYEHNWPNFVHFNGTQSHPIQSHSLTISSTAKTR